VTYFDLLSKCMLAMELHFDAILCSNLVTQSLMRAIPNVHAGRISPEGRTPAPQYPYFNFLIKRYTLAKKA